MKAAMEWLRENRCPWCRHRNQPACVYEIRKKMGGGWKCTGYRCDEERRLWKKKGSVTEAQTKQREARSADGSIIPRPKIVR